MTVSTHSFANTWYGHKLTTAEISYTLNKDPDIIQLYLWQEFDFPPTYPRFNEFLKDWLSQIDGKLYCVKIGVGGPLMPTSAPNTTITFSVH